MMRSHCDKCFKELDDIHRTWTETETPVKKVWHIKVLIGDKATDLCQPCYIDVLKKHVSDMEAPVETKP